MKTFIFLFFYLAIEFSTGLKQVTKLNKEYPTLLTYKNLYKINSVANPLKYGAGYLTSGKFLDEQDEVNLI
jgi:hypothetical protein